MIFLTVGTQFPFDRLVKAVDAAIDAGLINEQVLGQIGDGSYRPRNFGAVPSLDKKVFDTHVAEASAVISHAGMGIISMALAHKKPILVMPRLSKYREVVNDHQVAIARKFEQIGCILVAYDAAQLPEKIKQLPTFVPLARNVQPTLVAERIRVFLDQLVNSMKE